MPSGIASLVASRGVDPPRLPGFQSAPSPNAYPYPPRPRSVTLELYELGTIDEAIPLRKPSQDRRDGDGELVRDLDRSVTSPQPSETATDAERTSEDTTDHADHASVLPLPIPPTISATLPSLNTYSYTHPSTVAHQLSVHPPTLQTVASPGFDGLNKPTCSLNLMCYRSGSQGCIRRQIQVVRKWGEGYPEMIRNDQEFFQALHHEYEQHICGFWRRYLSLKTLRQIRLLSYTPTTRPEVVPMDDLTLQEVFHAYRHPENIKTECEWIDWVFCLRQDDLRHDLEFVEGWSGFRIALIGSLPWIVATVVGVAWTARGGDAQTAFTVAAFILTVGTCKSTRSDRMPTSS
jgi:hypothetical protein